MIAKGKLDEVAVLFAELARGHPKRKFILLVGPDGSDLYLGWGGRDVERPLVQVDAFITPFFTGTYDFLMAGCHATVAEAIKGRLKDARSEDLQSGELSDDCSPA